MMVADMTAMVQYFGYPGEACNVASAGVAHNPPDCRAAVDPLESMFTGFPGTLARGCWLRLRAEGFWFWGFAGRAGRIVVDRGRLPQFSAVRSS
jgi:hypothetical protein